MVRFDPFLGGKHDHRACVRAALSAAERLCADRHARLTPSRRRVLEAVWRGHGPVGAYGVLADLQQDDPKVKAPTVYRALDFLLAQGLVHRIERLNAYVGCAHPEAEGHQGLFLLCTGCGVLAELDGGAVEAVVAAGAAAKGFTVTRAIVEAEGLCRSCAAGKAGA